MPVDDRAGDPGAAGDGLDRDRVEALLADDLLGHVEQLLAAFLRAHPGRGDALAVHG